MVRVIWTVSFSILLGFIKFFSTDFPENFEWSQQLRDTMKRVFKLNDFRPQQLQTINCIMAKKDVILIAPTGGGKSLCYQLPAMLSDGLTVVVSPLISLMEDQVWSLKKYGVNAELLCASEKNLSKNNSILKQMADGKGSCKLVLQMCALCYESKMHPMKFRFVLFISLDKLRHL